MDAKLINPFIQAVTEVMQQMGFQNINKSSVAVNEAVVKSLGVMTLVGLTQDVSGNVVYNMTENTACYIASKMMCGMPVDDFNEMAQSAVSELANMLTARAATNLVNLGYVTDISTPNMTIGIDLKVKICDAKYLTIKMDIEGNLFEINIFII